LWYGIHIKGFWNMMEKKFTQQNCLNMGSLLSAFLPTMKAHNACFCAAYSCSHLNDQNHYQGERFARAKEDV